MTRNLKEFVNQQTSFQDASHTGTFEADHVVILMALFNGADTLPEQLESIAKQSHPDWSLIVSDDGSTDDWFDLMQAFAAEHSGKTWIAYGPGKGSACNFLELIRLAGPLVPYAALCDQDDVWLPPKISRALYKLRDIPPQTPALFVSPTFICDAELTPMRRSKKFARPPEFANALVQSIGGGNTMVLNRAALDLVQETARHAKDVPAHDWWIYQIVSGAGGIVCYDHMPLVLYRQHGRNQVGANDTVWASLRRLMKLLQGRYRQWNAANATALDACNHWLTPKARDTLQQFQLAREARLPGRLLAMKKAGVFRQTTRGQIALWCAVLLKRL
jgi:glycosyltransferase involved in cell wall biosynthesis